MTYKIRHLEQAESFDDEERQLLQNETMELDEIADPPENDQLRPKAGEP